MNWNRAFRLRSFAQLFSILTFLFIATSTQSAKAANPTKEQCNNSAAVNLMDDSQKDVCRRLLLGSGTSGSGGTDCDYSRRRADDKKEAFFSACKSSGMGIESCKKQQAACESAGGDDEYGNSAELLTAFSSALGVPQNSGATSQCSQYDGQGFYEEKDRINDKLKDIQKQLKDNKKEIADINEDFSKKIKDIQKDIADAQKELQDKQADIKKEQRERAAEQAKQAADMAAQIKKNETAILQKQQEKDDIYADKAQSLAQMTEDVANSTCMDTVRQAYLDRKKNLQLANQKSSLKSLASAGGSNSNWLNTQFKQCMSKFYAARLNLIRKSDAKIEMADKEIRNAQSESDNLQTQLSQQATLEQQAQADEQTQMSQQQQALQTKISNATSEMQSLQQSTQQKAQAVNDDSTALQKQYTELSNQLITLGAAPKGGRKSTTSGAEVAVAASEYTDARDNANKGECKYDDLVFGTSGGKKSVGPSRTGGSSSKTGAAK
ncbi:MAG: hypothetical protein JSU04_01415 [Bdellovibrionales bacterium]|nr:hypothetical protein [Bdellovibrionales bacterium]